MATIERGSKFQGNDFYYKDCVEFFKDAPVTKLPHLDGLRGFPPSRCIRYVVTKILIAPIFLQYF